jgi:hypothetical protein
LRSIDYLIAHDELDGPINLASPNPIPNREFMQVLRRTAGAATGLPSTRFMLEVGAWFLRTETELILKSRRVIPGRLLRPGSTSTFLTGRALQEIWSFAIAEGGANERSRDDDDNPFALEPLFFASTLAASGHVPSQGVHANCRWLSWAGGCSIGTPRDAQSNNGARLTRGQ